MYTWEPTVESVAQERDVDPKVVKELYFEFIRTWAQGDLENFVNSYIENMHEAGTLEQDIAEFITNNKDLFI